MPESPKQVLEQCHQRMAYAQNNHLLCLIPHYLSWRPLLFDCLDVLQLNTFSQDHQLILNQMTRVLNDLGKEGHKIDPAALKELSPYRTEHISRFGSYVLNMEREIQPLSPELQITKSP